MPFDVVLRNPGSGFNVVVGEIVVGGDEGYVPVWSGTAFVRKPVKVWNGAAWVIKPANYWSGTAWVTT